MIIEPDFLDDWRTRMLVDLLDRDEFAPLYILRLWSYCQTQRTVTFVMPAAGLKAQCRYAGNAEAFERAMIAAGFIERNDDVLHVLRWEEQNVKLIANWKNGKKGGRPPSGKTEEKDDDRSDFFDRGETILDDQLSDSDQYKLPEDYRFSLILEPTENPTETQPEPTLTQPEPCTSLGEPIREDKRRKKNIAHSATAEARTFSPIKYLTEHGIEETIAKDWLQTRKAKRLAPTETAFAGVMEEIAKAGLRPNDAIKYCCQVGWGSFKAHWPRTGSDTGKEVWES